MAKTLWMENSKWVALNVKFIMTPIIVNKMKTSRLSANYQPITLPFQHPHSWLWSLNISFWDKIGQGTCDRNSLLVFLQVYCASKSPFTCAVYHNVIWPDMNIMFMNKKGNWQASLSLSLTLSLSVYCNSESVWKQKKRFDGSVWILITVLLRSSFTEESKKVWILFSHLNGNGSLLLLWVSPKAHQAKHQGQIVFSHWV